MKELGTWISSTIFFHWVNGTKKVRALMRQAALVISEVYTAIYHVNWLIGWVYRETNPPCDHVLIVLDALLVFDARFPRQDSLLCLWAANWPPPCEPSMRTRTRTPQKVRGEWKKGGRDGDGESI